MTNNGSGFDRKVLQEIHEKITDLEYKLYFLRKLDWENYYHHNYGDLTDCTGN